MGSRRREDGVVSRHRTRVPREPKSLRLELDPKVYRQLLRLSRSGMDGRGEPVVGVIERLIREASDAEDLR